MNVWFSDGVFIIRRRKTTILGAGYNDMNDKS